MVGLLAGLWFSIRVLLPVSDVQTTSRSSKDDTERRNGREQLTGRPGAARKEGSERSQQSRSEQNLGHELGRSAWLAGWLRKRLQGPREQRDWHITLGADALVDLPADEAGARAEVYNALNGWLGKNHATIDARTDCFIAASASLFVQLAGWIIALIAPG